ncbi:MAG: NAD(P)H-dependent oxidoreductase subunit E, partial [Planctomycetes bacterium]|nr:NAD(P)H-dependent oxidoreductase subunit E [Planctomycetota bacterium]
MECHRTGSIIHELTLLQEKEGWLREDSLRALSRRLGVPLHRIESVSTFYTHFRRDAPKRVQIDVCRDLSCMLAGGKSACARLRQTYAERDDVEIREVSCIGRCESAPAGFVGHDPVNLDHEAEVDERVAALTSGSPAAPHPAPKPATWEANIYDDPAEHYGTFRRLLTGGSTVDDAISDLESSGLRGMGGAGFPTGLKWKLVRAEKATP